MHSGQLLDGFISYKSTRIRRGKGAIYIYIYIYIMTSCGLHSSWNAITPPSCILLVSQSSFLPRASFFIARVSALWEPVLGSSQLLLNTVVVWRWRMEEKRYINIASGTIWRRGRELLKCKLHYHSSPPL